MAEVTVPVNRLNADQLQEIISNIESIKPNAQGRYMYQGKAYTKTGLNNLLKPYKEQMKKLQEISAESAANQGVLQRQRIAENETEVNRVNRILVDITTRIEDLRAASERSASIEGQNNLRAWASYYVSQANRLQQYVNNLKNGTARSGDVQTDVQIIDVNQASVRPPSGGMPAQPGVTYGGVPGGGQAVVAPVGSTTSTGLTAAQRGEAGIMPGASGAMAGTGEQPVDLSGVRFTTTPAAAATPSTSTAATQAGAGTGMGAVTAPAGTQPASAGPAYVDPATGVSVQPGGQIGGEDRALPNGGAVVNGIYIPPGIDYTALGQAMQAAGIQIPAEWEKAAREMFGTWYDVFKNDPEMSAFLQRLMREPEMSDAMFMAELQKTNWWRTTNASARDFARRQVEDPATLNTQIANKTAALRQEALARGFTVADAALNDAALKSIQFGFSDQVVLNHLAQLTIESAQGPSSLVQGFYGQSVRETAAQYGIPLSETTLTKWVSDIATGNQSINSFDAYARDLARNLYPSLAKGFDSGLTFGQMTNPYAQVASSILEIPGETIDFTDPKWAAAFTMRNDKGEQMQMSFGEWSDYLRTNSAFGYEYTDEAVSKAYNVANDLAKAFGRA